MPDDNSRSWHRACIVDEWQGHCPRDGTVIDEMAQLITALAYTTFNPLRGHSP